MDPASSRAADPLPTTADLERVMAILGIPGDPVYYAKDHSDARRRAALLAHVAAAIVDRLGPAETLAELDIEDRADLHWDADCDVAAPSRRSPDRARLLDLQLARLAWVQHAVVRGRGQRPHEVADTVTATVGAIIQLVGAWRDKWPGRRSRQLDPMLADALLMIRDAADHLAVVLRTQPTFCRGRASATRGGPSKGDDRGFGL